MSNILLLLSAFALMISASEFECLSSCGPSILRKVCDTCRNHTQVHDNTEFMADKVMKRNRYMTDENTDTFYEQKSEKRMPKITKDYSLRIPTKQQIQNLEKYALYDYYIHGLNNYE